MGWYILLRRRHPLALCVIAVNVHDQIVNFLVFIVGDICSCQMKIIKRL